MLVRSLVQLQFLRRFFLCLLMTVYILIIGGTHAQAQSAGSLPVAVTIAVAGVAGQGGEVVVYDEATRSYNVAQTADADNVFGITVASPPLVFSTATNTTPVVTTGAVYVAVNTLGGVVERGDPLVTSGQAGVAKKADTEDEHAFAVALETASGAGRTQVLAQYDPETAQRILEMRREIENTVEAGAGGEGSNSTSSVSSKENSEKGFIAGIISKYTRATLAVVIALGSLFFIMYTFRTTIINATLAVGRNPRARNAIMTVSVENIVFALIICAVAIFIALAVLVLPV